MRKAARGKPAMNAPIAATPSHATHDVTKQLPPYGGHSAFIATRLAGDWGTCFGTLPAGIDCAALLRRARAGN